jgi:hypothetical protein
MVNSATPLADWPVPMWCIRLPEAVATYRAESGCGSSISHECSGSVPVVESRALLSQGLGFSSGEASLTASLANRRAVRERGCIDDRSDDHRRPDAAILPSMRNAAIYDHVAGTQFLLSILQD